MDVRQQNTTGVSIVARFFICNKMLQDNTLQMGESVKSPAHGLVG